MCCEPWSTAQGSAFANGQHIPQRSTASTRDGRRRSRLGRTHVALSADSGSISPARRRIAFNFAFLSAAELVCRTTSVIVTLSLAKRLGVDGYGRIEFAFSVVFWLVLLLRDSSDVIVARELSRHPRLIRPLVDQVLAYKTLFALILFSALALVGSLTLATGPTRRILALYGSMLFTTAIGLDYVFRGTERMGLVALSLCVRTGIYAFGVLVLRPRREPDRLGADLADVGEVSGIALVWLSYLKNYRLPRPRLSLRFLFDHGAARADGLLDPAFAGGDQLGGPAGGRVPELVERRRPLWGAAPDGDGPA